MIDENAHMLLKEGIAAAKAGNKALARPLLLEAMQIAPEIELGWLWLAGVAESHQEIADCLQRVLEINPENERARRGLEWAQKRGAILSHDDPPYEQPGTRNEQAVAVQGPPATEATDLRGIVLVVDDSPTVCKLVEITLEKSGYQVIAAADGFEALAQISEALPDLMLVDINMPRMDGYELSKTIKGNQETREIPIVMLSGKDGLVDKVRGKMAGAIDYMTKPFRPEELVTLVDEHAVAQRN